MVVVWGMRIKVLMGKDCLPTLHRLMAFWSRPMIGMLVNVTLLGLPI